LNKLAFNEDRCKGCGLCVHFCPRGVISLAERLNAQGYHPAEAADESKCTSCAICARVCPDAVIEVYREEKRKAG